MADGMAVQLGTVRDMSKYPAFMNWQNVVPPLASAAIALLGVRYGARLTAARESQGWAREQRIKAYGDLLEAVDKCYASFALIDASLNLGRYRSEVAKGAKIRTAMTEWGEWYQKTDDLLPRAELVASSALGPVLTSIRLGIRTRQQHLLMKLDYLREVDEAEWQHVARKSLDHLDRIRRDLRADLTRTDVEQGKLARLRTRLYWRYRKRAASPASTV
jgi:hypothetical protein